MAQAALALSARTEPHKGPVVDTIKGYDIVACEACGFRHVAPLPDAASLQAAYAEEYYRDEKPTYLAHAREDAAWFDLTATDRLATIETLLGGGVAKRLIEIGSGPGLFLKAAADRGWRTLGVEPSRQAAAHAQGLGLDIVNRFFDAETAAALPRADAVTMTNVLEHLPNPLEIVALARDLLKPGGVLMIAVPNDYSAFQNALRDVRGFAPWWIAPPHHLNYFDHNSLTSLVERLGLEVADISASFPMELFLLLGENYIGDAALGRACHTRRKDFDLTLEKAGLGDVRRRLYRALAEAGIGREAVVFGRKR